MDGRKAAVLSSEGIGDGLMAMSLVRNLRENGFETALFSDGLRDLEGWFPGADVRPMPPAGQMGAVFAAYARVVIGKDRLVPAGLREQPHCTSLDKDHCDHGRHFLDNVARICGREFGLRWRGNENGLVAPAGLTFRRRPDRVCMHPVSSRPAKNWPRSKFFELAGRLRARGLAPTFVVAPEERDGWTGAFPVAAFPALDEVAAFLYESGAMIAIDSGPGHLAANLGLPTLTLFNRRSASRMWRPVWGCTRVVTPRLRLPGRSGNRFWKSLLSVGAVVRAFDALLEEFAGRDRVHP